MLSLHESHVLGAWPLTLPGDARPPCSAKAWGDKSISQPRGTTAALPAPHLAGSPGGVNSGFTLPFCPPNHGVPAACQPSPSHRLQLPAQGSNDGNLISLHCTSNTSGPCKNQSELAGGSTAQPAFAPARSSACEQRPWAAFRTPPGPKCPGTGLWPCGGWRRSVPCLGEPQPRGGEVWDSLRGPDAAGDVAAVSGHLHRFQVPRLKAGLVIKSKKCATSVVFHFPFSTSSLPAAHRR